jgi:endonuclease YncB( thermonuclease family)
MSWFTLLLAGVLGIGVVYGYVRFDDLADAIGAPSVPTGTAGAPVGTATATDGDTIRIGEERIRLHGIDAAEFGQTCASAAGARWDCGGAARERLAALLAAGPVACVSDERDLYGRLVAVCTAADGTPINATLVREGLAWAYIEYSTDYVRDEAAARAEHRGIWQATTMPPWDYRNL